MLWVKVLILSSFVGLSISDCTWNSCPDWTDQETTYVHIVPHTHDDMGWKKTADDYYTGAHPLETLLAGVVYPGVQYVINTVLDELENDPTKRFSYCETGFLTRWLEDASRTQAEIDKIAGFISNGQLELIGGGWVQPDEAATHYVDLIDQYTLGLRTLQSYFGTNCSKPKVAWQIDPFGHSREHANLAVMMGYEGLFFAREHYAEHEMRLNQKRTQFMWQTSDDLNNTLLSGVFYNHYDTPHEFCWDVSCVSTNPIIDDENLNGYNVKTIVKDFTDLVNTKKATLPHNHVLVLMGSDFHYGNANMWFTNIDKLIYYMNQMTSSTKIKLFYSTPTCYLQAIQSTTTQWSSKTTDFFPYAYTGFLKGENSYWAGYFTSKPAFKGLVRQSSSLLQLVRKINAFANIKNLTEANTKEQTLERAIGLSQHHDAITGTSKEYVTQDYIAHLYRGWDDAEVVLNDAIEELSKIGRENTQKMPKQAICRAINETDCYAEIGTLTKSAVTVYNSHTVPQTTLVRIPLYQNLSAVEVLDSEGSKVENQVIKTFNNTALTGDPQLVNKDGHQAAYEIFFLADVDPLGFRTYFVDFKTESAAKKDVEKEQPPKKSVQGPTIIQNEFIMLHFDASGRLAIYHDLETNTLYNMTQDFMYYLGYGVPSFMPHYDHNNNQSSGAYVMRPSNNTPISIAQEYVDSNQTIMVEVINTSFSMEVRQHFSNWASQVIRLVKGKRYAEFEWTIGPIPEIFYEPFSSKEVITRYTVDSINSNGTFYTDSNGRQMVKRVRDFNPDYTYVDTEHVAANYYPVNSRIIVSDNNQALVVLTDRSEGGSSLNDGQVELLVHRRTFFDDGFGVNEPLNEMRDGRGLVVRGRHWVFLSSPKDLAKHHRTLAMEMYNTPFVAFSEFDSFDTYAQNYITKYSALCTSLPENINLLTFKQMNGSTLLVRLEHIFQKNEDSTLSNPQTVDLADVLPMFTIKGVEEMKLAANDYVSTKAPTQVQLYPMEIRTYMVSVTRKYDFTCPTGTGTPATNPTQQGGGGSSSATSPGTQPAHPSSPQTPKTPNPSSDTNPISGSATGQSSGATNTGSSNVTNPPATPPPKRASTVGASVLALLFATIMGFLARN